MPNVVWVGGYDFGDVGWAFGEVIDEGDKVQHCGADFGVLSEADGDGIALHRVIQRGEEGLGCREDDGGMAEFADNLLEDFDSNGTFAKNASEFLGDAIRFGLGQLDGSAVAVHKETEEFF